MKNFICTALLGLFFAQSFAQRPDLTISQITFTRLPAGPAGSPTRIRTDIVVRNLSRFAYQSSPNQQGVHIFLGNDRVVRSLPFQNIAANGAVTLHYNLTLWSLNEGRFFRASISYDPDIFLDGNRQNDDSNLNNNSLRINKPYNIRG